MNVAFVYDRVNKIGGAERVLSALHEIWPDAPLYTAVYDPKKAPWADVFSVKTTFMQHIPFAKNHHEWFAWLTPFAFGSLSFDQYDVVISVTSAEAKGIITKPNTLHICYCLTPTRYLWSSVDTYAKHTGFGVFHGIANTVFSLLLPILRKWDQVASMRPDIWIAISQRVKDRISRYYHRQTDAVIYPPVDTALFTPSNNEINDGAYYLTVSRLVPYKRVDIVIEACSHLGVPLVVIGSGSEEKQLRNMKIGKTIRFVSGNLTDQALVGYHQHCRAFLFAGDEDFGIVAGEAQACGKPVIAYRKSGVSEIIRDGKTGVLFDTQSAACLEEAILRFEHSTFSSTIIRKNAMRFDTQECKKKIKQFVEKSYKEFLSTL